jgi:hypothetical protein
MPLPYRHRFAATLAVAFAGGAFAGAALLAPGAATASPSSRTVTFNGGCGLLGLGASSQPDTASLVVASGSTVIFVNHLGQTAQLIVNGENRGAIPADNEVGILFRQGSATVAMMPGCVLGDKGAGSVTVAVGSSSPGVPGGSPSGSVDGSGSASRPARRPSSSRGGAAERPSPPPPAGAPAPFGPAPAVAGGPASAGANDTPGVSSSEDMVAVGAVGPATPAHRGSAGLLAIVATVCVLGVSIAAIRAITARRAISVVTA